ncbi:DUF3347 domain-containing protein [Aquimarina sp. 2201CG5-10]|uniref:DUF3347 domain-containing protein n=1 Tax=Aquimarina callyspongiae TaxID=3098150 RepID=UPI002AB40D19|nr:DUF3347 domain-containing protein [Aquimarina sp. 2201CG5-10]MDY8134721.1 DUF3347 domain-containing protein [Aquimarina sp. 2201CG5-10]
MKTILKSLILTIAITTVFSCGKDKKEQENIDQKENENTEAVVKDLNKTTTKSEVIFKDPSVTKVYNQYLNVKAALVNTNSETVRTEAKNLQNSVPQSEENKQLIATANLISLTKDVKKQRDFFVTLTQEIEKIIGNAEITSGEVYKQFCPMAFEGEGGYWLSNSKEVRNPYFGDRMLKCGSVNQTIK